MFWATLRVVADRLACPFRLLEVTPGRFPWPISACRTHLRSVSAVISDLASIDVIAAHSDSYRSRCSVTRCTAWRRTASGCLPGLLLRHGSILSNPGAFKSLGEVQADWPGRPPPPTLPHSLDTGERGGPCLLMVERRRCAGSQIGGRGVSALRWDNAVIPPRARLRLPSG
jgi:hypothetical protein